MMWYRLLFWASGWSGPYYHHRPFLLRNDHCLQLQLHFYCNAQFSEQDPHFNALELFLPWYVQVYIQEKKFLSRKGSFYSRKYVFFQQLQLFSDSELLWCNYTWYLVRLNLLKFYCPFCQILKFVLTFCNFFLQKKTKRSNKKKVPKALVTELNFSIPPPHRSWICSLFCKSFLIAWAKSNPEELSVKARTSALHRPDSATQDFWMFLQFNFLTFQTNKHLADRIRLSKCV